MNTVIPMRRAIAPALLVLFAACENGGGTQPEGPGSVQLTVSTTGRVLDRDGYSVSVDGGAAVAVQANGSAALSGLTPGAHTLAISGVAANCTLEGGASRSVAVQESVATPLIVAVQCAADRYAYVQGLGTGSGFGLYVARIDGTGVIELKRGVEPARLDWKADGYSLLYVRRTGQETSRIWSIDVVTRDSVLMVSGEGLHLHPQWSPGGDRIAFTSADETFPFTPSRITIINADGSGRRGVTGYAGSGYESMPTWSPDGNSVAYRRGPELRIVGADGTGDRLVTDMAVDSYTEIAWSPDGAWLVWSAWDPATITSELYRIHPDGTGRAAITATQGVWEQFPSFMADGRLLFEATVQGGIPSDPWAVAVDGSGRVNMVTTPQVLEMVPAWQ
jgi:WD40-like Beta Propeller Repeat